MSVKVTTLYLKDLLSFKSKYTLVYIELLDVAWNSAVKVFNFQNVQRPGWVGSGSGSGLLLWARQAGDIDRLLQQRRANAGSATLSAYVVAEHRLVFALAINE